MVSLREVAALLLAFPILGCAALTPLPGAAEPVLKVVRGDAAGVQVLRNGDFEAARVGRPTYWTAYEKGFRLEPQGGRGGSHGVLLENPTGTDQYGVSQRLELFRTSVAPLVVRGWSRAEGVSGSPDAGYSLYVDIVYSDGTPLWGRTADFTCGTHDWEHQEVLILPQKPVRTLTVYCLLRGHTGKAWFDDLSVTEVRSEGDAALLQGLPVVLPDPMPLPSGPARQYQTRDRLSVGIRDGAVASVRIDGRDLTSSSPSGFMARDAAEDSDFHGFRNGACPELGLKLDARFGARSDHIAVSGRITDTTGKDRAVTLVFALPVDAEGWRWGDDIHRSRVVGGRDELQNSVPVACGSTGTLSLYPLGAVAGPRDGIALAVDMGFPAVYRISYHPTLKQLLVTYDFGLVPETERFPGGADFRFVIYRFSPKWGFRSAFEKLTRIFPDYFRVRSRDQGIWMPFTDVSTVQGWQDFGFRYHEGDNNLAFDDANGILSFRYTEPMTWWMSMPKETPRTVPEALRQRDAILARPNDPLRALAQATLSAGMQDEAGQPALLFRDTPWSNGAVWSLNPNPHLPGPVNGASLHWNPQVRERLYGPEARHQQDGEYLDSLEGYVTAEMNYRREHFRHTSVPLTFATASKRPALFKGLAIHEFTRWISDDLHRLGKLVFANGVPYRFGFLCPWLDVLGTETDWLPGGRWAPASDAQMSAWRTLSGAKPYLLLMNTDYDALGPELVERYFQRSLFYGMLPSMFSHNAAENPYWRNPAWYNRDRPLFRKYIPIIKQIAEAGWQPVTYAASTNPDILVERFGPSRGAVFLTLLNDTDRPQEGTLTVEIRRLGLPDRPRVTELVTASELSLDGGRLSVTLGPYEARALRLSR